MKRFFFTILAMSLCFAATNAQTIHWLTFVDTTDENVGGIDVYGRQMLYSYFIDEVNSALQQKGYKSDIQDFYGYQVSPENCKAAVNMLRITHSDDIIVFYYIGHGGRPVTDSNYMREHPYPQMCLAQSDEKKFIPLEWVNEQLSSKGARLSVTIGMCCNSLGSGISMKDEPKFSPNYGATYMSSKKMERIQELFLNTKGHVIATSASPTQTSGCVQIDGPVPCHPLIAMQNPQWFRDWYSFAICSFFQTQLDDYNDILTWEDFLSKISWFVDHYTNQEQTPIHEIHLVQEPKVDDQKPEAVTVKEVQKIQEKQKAGKTIKQGDTDSRDWINDLTNQLSTLINTSLSYTERQALEMNLYNKLFAQNAVVKFLAQESGAVIDKADVSDWLGILATNPNGRIIKVIVEEGIFDSDKKISVLKVKEIYKK